MNNRDRPTTATASNLQSIADEQGPITSVSVPIDRWQNLINDRKTALFIWMIPFSQNYARGKGRSPNFSPMPPHRIQSREADHQELFR